MTRFTRNFCIIAHIDHGKSTLADRFLLLTGAITEREFRDQFLDDMDLERERGITIKASAVTMHYERPGGAYVLNLIDTPGHVDFSYEVSRALAACEGAILLVDAAQGVEAQSVANAYLAMEHDLTVVPVVSKVDLPHAQIEETIVEMEHVFGVKTEEILKVSAKEGTGVREVLDAVVERVPPPSGDEKKPLRALVFDCVYDDYKGVVIYVRLTDGRLSRGDKVRLATSGKVYAVDEVGRFRPGMMPEGELRAGDVGYLTASVKSIHGVRVGDTVCPATELALEPLPGYKEPKPMVFCGLFPAQDTEFGSLRKAMERLSLNDASFVYRPDTSEALGMGFRCGFLGLLHMEIVQERLERESGVEVVQTAPNVTFQIEGEDGGLIEVNNPAEVPDASTIKEFREPVVRLQVVTPASFIGPVMKLCDERRARYLRTEYLSQKRVILEFDCPLMEIIYDFFDKLKSATRGRGTMDYELLGYFPSDLVRLDILVNGRRVDALSTVCHRSVAERRGRAYVRRLKKEIPRHLFQIPLQAAIGGRVVARENISALKKDVTAKCYGGDVTRKRKLLDKQREGKRRMRAVGQVSIPQEAFLAILKARGD